MKIPIAILTLFCLGTSCNKHDNTSPEQDNTLNDSTLSWISTFGTPGEEKGYSIIPTDDSGFVITGVQSGYMWISKVDANGKKIWSSTPEEGKGYSIAASPDGGFVAVGNSALTIADLEFLIVKVDKNGNKVWVKKVGGSREDIGRAIISWPDGGYIIAGLSASNDFDNTFYDFWVQKTDANGNTVWGKSLGGKNMDLAYALAPTTDGNFVVAGLTQSSTSGDVVIGNPNQISANALVVKMDGAGNKIWAKTIGVWGDEVPYGVAGTSDGGCVIAGLTTTDYRGGDTLANIKNYDIFLARLDRNGKAVWRKAIGGAGNDVATSIARTKDDGFLISGYTDSNNSGDIGVTKGKHDILVLKINGNGDLKWIKTIGGAGEDFGYNITSLQNGSAITGASESNNNGDIPETKGDLDILLGRLH
jgi:hypothetical protein